MLGCLEWNSPTHVALFRQFANDHVGKVVRIEIPKATRSNPQNNYYWHFLGIISKETGDDVNSLHEYFKRKFLPPQTIKVTLKGVPQEIKIPASTADLSKSDFGDYLDRICVLTEVPLPDPTLAGYTLN